MWEPHELTTDQKQTIVLKCCHLFYETINHFSVRLWCARKSGFYGNQQPSVQWLDPQEVPKYFPEPNLHQKKGHGHCFVVWCQSDPLQLSGSWQNHYIWKICSANLWETQKIATLQQHFSTEWVQTFSTTINASKVEWIGLWSFVPSAILPWPFVTLLPLLQVSQQHFSGQMLPQDGDRKCFPSFLKAEVQIFTLKG